MLKKLPFYSLKLICLIQIIMDMYEILRVNGANSQFCIRAVLDFKKTDMTPSFPPISSSLLLL